MRMSNNHRAFFALVQGGLWEREVRLEKYGEVDYYALYRLSQLQSVVGLVAAGVEHLVGAKIPQQLALQFVGDSLQFEQRCKSMNEFIGLLFSKFNSARINALLVKGQGIAQCYERPLWRAAGDVDLLLDKENYDRAKSFLLPQASKIEEEDTDRLHLGLTIDSWLVELHGTLHGGLGKKVDRELDEIQDKAFKNGNHRKWQNGNTIVLLPSSNDDIVFVFAHILQHFYGGGIGLRQVCDWCRLVFTYQADLDVKLLEERLRRMGIITEWKAFASLAVNLLGMPAASMPLFSEGKKWRNKADNITRLILASGNFGQGFDKSYKKKYPKALEYLISFWLYTKYGYLQFLVFPLPAIKGWIKTVFAGAKSKFKKK